MSGVTAKFKVGRRTEMNWATEVEMTPDYVIRLTIKNELAAKQFKEGAEVDVLFTFPEA